MESQDRYIVEGNLDHDQKLYSTGDIVVLNEKQAAQLLAVGRVRPATEALEGDLPRRGPGRPEKQPEGEGSEPDKQPEGDEGLVG